MDNTTIDTVTEGCVAKKQYIRIEICPYESHPEKPNESLCTNAIEAIPTRKQEYCLSNNYTNCVIYQECQKKSPDLEKLLKWINGDIT